MSDNTSQQKQFTQASLATADDLKNIAHTLMKKDVSRLTLPQVNEAVDIVSNMVPAGNVPGVILNGLARLSGKRPPKKDVDRDMGLLFRGVGQVLDKAVYGALFAGPAAVIWGYQNLLKLAGKNPDDAFPEGTWQFYVDYALREDTARHANETHGFDTLLNQHRIGLSEIDRVTAWVMTAIQTIHNYPALLENEWRERVHTRLLYQLMADTPQAKAFQKLYGQWERQRPYGRRADAGQDMYTAYRRRLFDDYMQQALTKIPEQQQLDWNHRKEELEANALPAYLEQMTIISYLEPDSYHETRTSYALEHAHIGVIRDSSYYLIPVMQDKRHSNDIMTVRSQVAAIMRGEISNIPTNLTQINRVKRASLSDLRKKLSENNRNGLQWLQFAPIIINADQRPSAQPLANIRQAERGGGDHALTIFDTGKTFVFDQSHIYFDGAWGAALAEIMTNEALSWAQYLAALPAPQSDPRHIQPIAIQWSADETQRIVAAPKIPLESTAESDSININLILELRKIFKQRNDLIQLTVNDLLVLYRAIHAVEYKAPRAIVSRLQAMLNDPAKATAAQLALDALSNTDNPSILIPIDASPSSPSERLYPMSFDVPLSKLDFITLHKQSVSALQAYKDAGDNRSEHYQRFDELQRKYLATLGGFGAVLSEAKRIATEGESASVGTIKLLAHMPAPLQRLLDEIPSRVEILNDIIKGKEVFSNVGAVAPTSTLTRFITAKDDNEKKTLAWGIITDADRTTRISLRDFRPHVGALQAIDDYALAHEITEHYLESYVTGLNLYIRELRRITLASRQTRMVMENLDE